METSRPTILDGKALAARMRAKMADVVRIGREAGMRAPGLAVILVGDDAASQIYVRNKQKACMEAGIVSVPFFLPSNANEHAILDLIADLNGREEIDGILLQLPLPAGIDPQACLEAISPEKDVDGFHPLNLGKLVLGLPGFVPCTPAGVIELLNFYDCIPNGKKAVVAGRSNIVGKPLAILLARKNINATVTICHSGTPDLKKECLEADFIFSAMGCPHAITGDMVKPGCVAVDIGINRTPDGIAGDIDFETVAPKAAAITPVPGGIGPMTIAMLLQNTLSAWKKNAGSFSNGQS